MEGNEYEITDGKIISSHYSHADCVQPEDMKIAIIQLASEAHGVVHSCMSANTQEVTVTAVGRKRVVAPGPIEPIR